MYMDNIVILARIQRGICDFLREDTDLLTNDANERSISHKLAEHLQKYFNNLKVDCEYNRHGNSVKRLRYSRDSDIGADDLDVKTVFPDIIIHNRGIDQCNLVIIEIKKSNSSISGDTDEQKLRSFTEDEYKYQLGLFLVADVKNKRLIIKRAFRCGQEITDEISVLLRELGFGE